ncbi:MAG: hypothetical protein ACKVOH_01345 [Chlamydiales bacterium]
MILQFFAKIIAEGAIIEQPENSLRMREKNPKLRLEEKLSREYQSPFNGIIS